MQILLSKACPSGKTKWYVLKTINFTFQVAEFSVFAFAVVVAFFDPFREVLQPLFLCERIWVRFQTKKEVLLYR